MRCHRHLPLTAAPFAAGLVVLAFCATPASAKTQKWTVPLTGAAEVPGPGNADASGTATISVDDDVNMLCYHLVEKGLADATGAHVHKGAKGVAGPVVVPLQAPVGGAAQACTPIDHAAADAILADPAGYYVNIHSTKYPAGALRAQLGG